MNKIRFDMWYSDITLKRSLQVLLKDRDPHSGTVMADNIMYKIQNGIHINLSDIEIILKYDNSSKILEIYADAYHTTTQYFKNINHLLTDSDINHISEFILNKVYYNVIYENNKDYTIQFIDKIILHFITDIEESINVVYIRDNRHNFVPMSHNAN